MIDAIRAALGDMAHSPVRNYATPGLSSFLIGGAVGAGKVRLFKSDRHTRHWITPHSHRFNFTCLVLRGSVENIIFRRAYSEGDLYCVGILAPIDGGLGGYDLSRATVWTRFTEHPTIYKAGETYSMRAEEIHSIRFSAGAEVLFFEGPELMRTSMILEPWSNDAVVPTFETAAWMFERDGSTSRAEPAP